MKRIILGAATLLLLGVHCVRADERDDATTLAKSVLDAMVKDDYELASKHFSAEVKKQLPPDKLKETWKTVQSQVGAFKKLHSTSVVLRGGGMIVTLTCEFENAALDFDLTVEGKEIGGLFFRQNLKLAYLWPTYVKPETFREVEVKINPGDWELPGTLTLPKGEGRFPVVVLIHGSGPNDRDETIGPNLPFRDLAGGLATKGIAVLRFEKRTREYGYKLMKQNIAVTIKEEVIDDALAAVQLLRARKEIDPKQIYVLGHSLGGNVAPLIGQQDDKLAGLIVMAGNTRPLQQMVVDQLEYLQTLSDKPSEESKKQLEEIKKLVERINDPKLEKSGLKNEQILGAPIAYWLSLRNYDPAATAAKLKMPMLILQGERDYQVTMADFDTWKKVLTGNDNVRFKLYPKLNHLFMDGQGKSKPAEYDETGHVSSTVIDDIAGWIKKH